MALTFEYRLDGGSAQPLADSSPATITGLAEDTEYSLEIRAVKHSVAGAWSTVWTFTTAVAHKGPVYGDVYGQTYGAVYGILVPAGSGSIVAIATLIGVGPETHKESVFLGKVQVSTIMDNVQVSTIEATLRINS